jgi:hypothetical protein
VCEWKTSFLAIQKFPRCDPSWILEPAFVNMTVQYTFLFLHQIGNSVTSQSHDPELDIHIPNHLPALATLLRPPRLSFPRTIIPIPKRALEVTFHDKEADRLRDLGIRDATVGIKRCTFVAYTNLWVYEVVEGSLCLQGRWLRCACAAGAWIAGCG